MITPHAITRWRERPSWVDRLIGVAVLLGGWHVLAVTVLDASRVVPTPWEVISQLWRDRDSYPINVRTTLREAVVGYLWGNLIAILLGIVFELVPIVEAPLLRVAIAAFNIPLVAIAPILVVVLSGDGPKAALAALSVFFTTLVATILGVRSADATSLEVVRVYGGGRTTALLKVKLWAALPSLLAGLRIAAPAALLGALIGEYLGANQGLGAALIQSQSSFAVARTWGIALVASALAGALYLAVSLLARIVTPWAGQTDLGSAPRAIGHSGVKPWERVVRSLGLAVISIGAMLGVWHGLVHGFNLNSFFAKDPDDVYRFLFTAPKAGMHREVLLDALGRTLKDAVAGYLVGTAAATIVAVAIVLSRGIEQAVMPVAIVLRSVPLVAMTPLIALIFGRGFFGVTAVVTIVTFFPTLVNVAVGLRSASAQACDVVRAAGGGPLMAVRLVRLPSALPAFFSSAKIAAPAAIGGATLAEWLATGKGLGSLLVISYSRSDFNSLWSGATLIVAVSVMLYSVVGLAEDWVLARMRDGGI